MQAGPSIYEKAHREVKKLTGRVSEQFEKIGIFGSFYRFWWYFDFNFCLRYGGWISSIVTWSPRIYCWMPMATLRAQSHAFRSPQVARGRLNIWQCPLCICSGKCKKRATQGASGHLDLANLSAAPFWMIFVCLFVSFLCFWPPGIPALPAPACSTHKKGLLKQDAQTAWCTCHCTRLMI